MTSTAVDRIYGLSSGVAIKAPVRVATTAAITLSGLQTVDGQVLVADDRVLVKNQADTTANGIYLAATSTWQRDQDFDGARDAVKGTLVFVTAGAVSGGLFYEVTTANPITIGTSAIVWAVTNPGTPLTVPVPIVQGGTGSSTAATARTALGSTTTGDALFTSASASAARLTLGTDAVLTNSRLAKTALYTVLNADKGRTIALGGSAFFTLTFGGTGSYDANFMCLVLNEDGGRGKTISLAGVGTFILYPSQSCIVYSSGGVWRTAIMPDRWILQADTTFFVDKTLGSNSNDGLLAGSGGAFATIQKAINVVSRNAAIDCNNFTVTIRVAAGSYSENLNVFGGLIGADVFNLVGDIATPSNVVLQTSTITPCLTARDYGTVDISGFRFASTASGATYLSAAQSSTIDMHACDFGNGNGAVHMYADSGGFINVTGNYSISTAAMTFHAFARYGGSIRGGGGLTVTCTQTMAFNTFWIAQYGGFIGANGSAVTFTGAGAGGASTGTKYDVSLNGTIELDSTTLPGATAGATATGGQVSA